MDIKPLVSFMYLSQDIQLEVKRNNIVGTETTHKIEIFTYNFMIPSECSGYIYKMLYK